MPSADLLMPECFAADPRHETNGQLRPPGGALCPSGTMCPNPARDALRAELLAAMVPLGAREHESAVLAEAEYALRPHVHEGKVVAYGFAHVDRLVVPDGATLIRHDQMPLRVARILADGSASFVCLEAGEYSGLLVLGTPCEDEYDLVRLRTAIRPSTVRGSSISPSLCSNRWGCIWTSDTAGS